MNVSDVSEIGLLRRRVRDGERLQLAEILMGTSPWIRKSD